MNKDKLAQIDRLLQHASENLESYNKTLLARLLLIEFGTHLSMSIHQAQGKISEAVSLVDDLMENKEEFDQHQTYPPIRRI